MNQIFKKAVVLLTATALFLVTSATAFGFSDVKDTDIYAKGIKFLSEKKIVSGYRDGTFGYNKQINRAEFLKIVMQSLPVALEAVSKDNCFKDVPTSAWYYDYACAAKNLSFVAGYSDGTFRPKNPVRFTEALKMILSVYNFNADKTDPWYIGVVKMGAGYNLIPITIKSFDHYLTRAEMADMTTRMMNIGDADFNGVLGDETAYYVTYDTIKSGIDIYAKYVIDHKPASYGAAGTCRFMGAQYANGETIDIMGSGILTYAASCICTNGELKECKRSATPIMK
jgi:hypothetical protein